jgi:hypothetical protein
MFFLDILKIFHEQLSRAQLKGVALDMYRDKIDFIRIRALKFNQNNEETDIFANDRIFVYFALQFINKLIKYIRSNTKELNKQIYREIQALREDYCGEYRTVYGIGDKDEDNYDEKFSFLKFTTLADNNIFTNVTDESILLNVLHPLLRTYNDKERVRMVTEQIAEIEAEIQKNYKDEIKKLKETYSESYFNETISKELPEKITYNEYIDQQYITNSLANPVTQIFSNLGIGVKNKYIKYKTKYLKLKNELKKNYYI